MMEAIKKCRICGSSDLKKVIDIGVHALTGTFPSSPREKITKGPLALIKCKGPCGLLQLSHIFDKSLLFGDNYGYRSGLNISMVEHLKNIAAWAVNIAKPVNGDVVVDIGSNDATLLKYFSPSFYRIGIDPADKFRKFYQKDIEYLPEYFHWNLLTGRKAKIITSIAMFYDLDSPIKFMQDIHDSLVDDGIWITEQSYLPEMLKKNSFDTICQEHQEYYAFSQIKFMADAVGFKIVDIGFNDKNGGSFIVTMAKRGCEKYREDIYKIAKTIVDEEKMLLGYDDTYIAFQERITRLRWTIQGFLNDCKKKGKTVLGYGASTKGNVLLQFCGLTDKELPAIGDVNEEKFGKYTPGTGIKIIPESAARKLKPDYFFVLPWHFKENIVKRESEYLKSGGALVFPLPRMEIYGKSQLDSCI